MTQELNVRLLRAHKSQLKVCGLDPSVKKKMPQESTARQHCKTALQDSTARQHCKTALQDSTARQHCQHPLR
jgi:hypothetical protein